MSTSGYPPEEVEPWRDWLGNPGIKPPPIPKDVTPQTMLRLAMAARMAFPDGSMSVGALRRAGSSGRLRVYRIAGKDFTTLADIGNMKEAAACQDQAKGQGFISSKSKGETLSGISETGNAPSALAALRANAQKLKSSLASTSPANITPEPAGAVVIPMRSK